MKKHFYTIILAVIGISFVCCESEEDESNSLSAQRDRYRDLLFPTTWISSSSTDSIIIEFGYNGDTVYYSDIDIYEYEVNNSINRLVNKRLYRGGYLSNNKLTLSTSFYPKMTDEVSYSFDLNGDKLILYNFLNDRDYMFYKENRIRERIGLDILSGVWTTTLNKDSVALVFENGRMKEYVYDKNSKEILKYTDYICSLYRNTYIWQDRTRIEDKMWLSLNGKIMDISRYTLDEDKLFIYSSTEPIVYRRE